METLERTVNFSLDKWPEILAFAVAAGFSAYLIGLANKSLREYLISRFSKQLNQTNNDEMEY